MSDTRPEGLQNIKHIVAIASGKGGVGKSTTTVNVALAMAKAGFKVGVLDADIYGPSQGLMLGIAEGSHPETMEEKWFVPIQAHGVSVMSMAFLVDANSPMVWRGPMAAGALQQMLLQTNWGELDYLFVDMPPGTGDIQLTLCQKAQVSGAVIVTTPQDLALLDARKGIEMFNKVKVPVLGIVENMSTHVCSQCNHEEAIFGAGGGEALAQEYGTDLLASLPLSMAIRVLVDGGTPTVVAEPQSAAAHTYVKLAHSLVSKLDVTSQSMPSISIDED
ncbi:iron-sulfur cluster carrier protein ApbC [Candidatus Njordibacter sp. Uisw_056]|jgi:ATP-binding protein involved in chromosome partitioning|uniref:iron-sulfur cluster carrier protein ApbC n=1 Tax=Candidatus Njordibacter sp. Uisw_056 TaxID=3230973 RepID=UPI003D561EDA|tara:strand:+ start:3261 stop:4088 length:828 start_codon:yes stop_codon:yes gene_type:complete